MLYVNPLQDASFARTDPARLDALQRRQALEEFERVFLYQLLRQMRKTVPESSLFGKSSQREYFEEMMDDVLAGEMARSGQFGVAALLEEQLRVQELQKTLEPAQAYPGGISLQPEAAEGLALRPGPESEGVVLNPLSAGLPLERNPGLPLQGS